MYLCLKCNKRRRAIESIETDKKSGKKYLVTKCMVCKAGLDIEEVKKK